MREILRDSIDKMTFGEMMNEKVCFSIKFGIRIFVAKNRYKIKKRKEAANIGLMIW